MVETAALLTLYFARGCGEAIDGVLDEVERRAKGGKATEVMATAVVVAEYGRDEAFAKRSFDDPLVAPSAKRAVDELRASAD